MTDTDRATARWTWQMRVPVTVTEDEPMMRALEQQAVARARRDGLTVLDVDPVVTVVELSPVEVAMMARVDTEDPSSEWYGLPDEVVEAEVQARESAARNLRVLRVELCVVAEEERPALRQLGEDAAAEVMRMGLEADAGRATRAAVCGSPGNRHDFLPAVAELLRDGRLDGAPCQKCDRDVTRDELLANAAAESRGETWWQQ